MTENYPIDNAINDIFIDRKGKKRRKKKKRNG